MDVKLEDFRNKVDEMLADSLNQKNKFASRTNKERF